MDTDRPTCPRCSRPAIPIAYGFIVDPAVDYLAGRGKIALGGCVIREPRWTCPQHRDWTAVEPDATQALAAALDEADQIADRFRPRPPLALLPNPPDTLRGGYRLRAAPVHPTVRHMSAAVLRARREARRRS